VPQPYRIQNAAVEGELLRRKVLREEAAEADARRSVEEALRALLRPGTGGRWRTVSAPDPGDIVTPTPEELNAWAQERYDGVTAPRPARPATFERARLALALGGESALGRAVAAHRGRIPAGPTWDVWTYLVSVVRASLGRAYRFRPGGRHSGSRVGACAARAETVARAVGTSVSTVRRALARLAELGALVAHRTGRGSLRVPVAPPPAEVLTAPRWDWFRASPVAERPEILPPPSRRSGDPISSAHEAGAPALPRPAPGVPLDSAGAPDVEPRARGGPPDD
jgi:hypothetical protein